MSDFAAFLDEVGLTQAQMDAAAAAMPKPIPREVGDGYRVFPSPIHGVGCFATRDIDGRIGAMRHGESWCEAGLYINHSAAPNAIAVMQGDTLVAYGKVAMGDEITLDYRQVRDSIMGET